MLRLADSVQRFPGASDPDQRGDLSSLVSVHRRTGRSLVAREERRSRCLIEGVPAVGRAEGPERVSDIAHTPVEPRLVPVEYRRDTTIEDPQVASVEVAVEWLTTPPVLAEPREVASSYLDRTVESFEACVANV